MKVKVITETLITTVTEVEVMHGSEGTDYLLSPPEQCDAELRFNILEGDFNDGLPEEFVESARKQLAHLCGKNSLRYALKFADAADAAHGVARELPVTIPPGGAKA